MGKTFKDESSDEPHGCLWGSEKHQNPHGASVDSGSAESWAEWSYQDASWSPLQRAPGILLCSGSPGVHLGTNSSVNTRRGCTECRKFKNRPSKRFPFHCHCKPITPGSVTRNWAAAWGVRQLYALCLHVQVNAADWPRPLCWAKGQDTCPTAAECCLLMAQSCHLL